MERVPQDTLDTLTEYGETWVVDAFQTGNEILKSSYEYLAIDQHNFVLRAAMRQQTKKSDFCWYGIPV
jgi:hypothetical protein